MTESATALYPSFVTVAGVVLLLYLVVRRRLHAFPALLLVSLGVGLAAQGRHTDPAAVLEAMQAGMGGTLGYVAIVVGLGAMFGKVLEVSGGAHVLARGLLSGFGPQRAPWALSAAGFLISMPVFFDVAFIVLIPLLTQVARASGQRVPIVALPLLAGMVVSHAFVPPTPGPIGVAGILGADLGWVIAVGIAVGLPAVACAGPYFVHLGRPMLSQLGASPAAEAPPPNEEPREEPALGRVLALILLPLVLILVGSATPLLFPVPAELPTPPLLTLVQLVGHPFVALLVALLVALYLLGGKRGLPQHALEQALNDSLLPVGMIVLVTGAGGVLKQVMVEMGVGKALASQLTGFGLSPLVLAYLLAAVVRVMQGSATVAMLTAAGLLTPLLATEAPSPLGRALLVVAVAAGASGFSHVNDSGFWLVSRYLKLSVSETFKSWTVLTTLVSVVGLLAVLVVAAATRTARRRLGAPQRPALAHSLGVEYDLEVIKTGKRLKDRRSKTPRNPGGSVGMAKALWSTVPLPSSNEDRVLAVGVDAIFKALMGRL